MRENISSSEWVKIVGGSIKKAAVFLSEKKLQPLSGGESVV